jgi:hypothetical protein
MQRTPNLYNTLLRLDYEDVLKSCQVNPESNAICMDPVFWEDKAQQDFGVSLRQIRSSTPLMAREKYLAILSQEGGITRGSEKFLDCRECVRRSIAEGKPELTNYFVEQGGVGLNELLVEATRDKATFDRLVREYNVNIFADPQLLYLILLGAVQNKNFPLVTDIAPEAAVQITAPEQIEDILNAASEAAAKDKDYAFMDHVHDYFYLGETPKEEEDEWLLQTALLARDEAYAEEIIARMLERKQYGQLAAVFVRVDDYDRIVRLIQFADFNQYAYLGQEILNYAVRYNRPQIVKLIAEDRAFSVVRRRSWIEDALYYAEQYGHREIIGYLNSLLATIY